MSREHGALAPLGESDWLDVSPAQAAGASVIGSPAVLGNDATGTDPANAGFADLDVADVPNVTPQDVLERDCLAIVVTSPQNPRLGRILRSVASQTLLPARLHIAVVGLDASMDNVQTLAQKCLGEVDLPFVVQSSRGANFSQAVEDVLAGAGGPVVVEKNEDDAKESASSLTEHSWIWLLHGDAAADPDCLEWLVRHGSASSKIGALGPKQVSWEDRTDLLEVGIRATRSGRRVPEIHKGDRDQGQLDAREDVLGVGSAGMLVRREALEAVGGLDPALGPFGDGLETSRRLWVGGWRVAVVPRAVIRHARESMSKPARSTFAARRAAQLYNAVLAAPLILAPLLWLGYIVAAPIRALVRLAMKEPHMVWPEIAGAGQFIGKFGDLCRARRRIRGATSVPASVLRTLEDSPRAIRQAQRAERKALRDAAEMATMPDPITLAEQRRLRSRTRGWAFATFLLTTLMAAGGLLRVIGRGVLTGGALLPDASGIRELASMAASGWLPSGDGVSGPIDALWLALSPFVALSEPLGGSLGAVATAIILCAIPLAGMAAYWGAGTFTRAPALRFLAGVLWAFAPPLLASVAVGQVAGAIWHILAPLALALLTRCWRGQSVSLVGRASLVLAVMCAAAPLTILVVIAVIVAAVVRRSWRWLWISVPALALMAPSFAAAMGIGGSAPWRFLFAVPGVGLDTQPSTLGILTLSPTQYAEGLGSLDTGGRIAAAGILAVAVVGVLAPFRAHRSAWIRWGWVGIAAGYAWALADSSLATGVSTDGGTLTPVNTWAGIALSCAALGIWTVLVNAGDGMRAKVREYPFGLRQLGAGIILLGALGGILAPAGVWAVNNTRHGTLTVAPETVPAIAQTGQQSDARSRVLWLSPSSQGIQAQVLRGDGVQLHEASMLSSVHNVEAMDSSGSVGASGLTDAREDLAEAIADINGSGERAAAIFGEHAIAMVVVPLDTDNPARAALVGELSSLGGLQYVTENSIGAFWRVTTTADVGPTAVSRLRIVQPTGEDDVALPSGHIGARLPVDQGAEGRLLVLAERADSGWRATLNGEPLDTATLGWRQAWELPSSGGELVIGHGPSVPWPGLVQVAVIGIAIIIALPLRRKRYES